MRHQFTWHDGPIEIKLRTTTVSFDGAFICANCGLQMPVRGGDKKQRLSERIRMWDDKTGEDDCALRIVDGVLES